LAAGFSPDPQGELKCSPDPLAAMRGPTSKEKGRGDRGGEREREKFICMKKLQATKRANAHQRWCLF